MNFILASASPRRLSLLKQISLTPDSIIPADINEDPIIGEMPRGHALRLASEKCQTVQINNLKNIILSADTVVGVGRRILPKAENLEQAEQCLDLLSGRSHRVFTGIAVYSPHKGLQSKVVETRLKFKRLSSSERQDYLNSNEWQGKAGGYGIQGYAESFIESLSGSYSNVVGLPLYETRHLLQHHGVKPS